MSNKPFVYQDPFPLKKDDTEYYLLSSDYVSVAEFAGQEVLKVDPQALTLLAQHAFHDASFMLRPAHQQQVADILNDPEASENDKYVALQFLRNSDIAAKGILPTCQDTGTAIIMGKKGQRVWTGGGDEAALAQGVYNTYIQDNLRYSQNAPLDMYKEVNTGTNLPAQIDLYATDGDEYKFLPGEAEKLPRREDAHPRYCRLSTVPYRLRDRRYLGGSDAEDREAGVHQILRWPADRR